MKVGLVVIGRNEGDRLWRCLEAAARLGLPLVYVDSASTDGSAALARARGCEVVELDPGAPLSAARARNEGFRRLREVDGGAEFVQFLDGDCVLADGWVERAARELEERPDVAAACGRLRERHPEASVYNRLCDLEWNGPEGEVAACGGNAMMRLRALEQTGGFDPAVVAGEEPELCLRMRRAGWKILRVDAEMATHDAAMTRFGQWWRRCVRSGQAYAQAAALHGRGPERFGVRESASVVAWALWVPVAMAALAWPTGGWSLLLGSLYPCLLARVAWARRGRGDPWRSAWLYSAFCVLGKWPQLQGQLRFFWGARRGRAPRLVEYKSSAPLPPPARAKDSSGVAPRGGG